MNSNVFANNIYVLKYFFKASPINTILFVFSEICKSIYFAIFVVVFTEMFFNNLDQSIQYVDYIYLLMIYLVLALAFFLFSAVAENYIIPKMYYKTRNYIAERLYIKSTLYDIKCLEDGEYYNRFTIASSETFERATEALELLCDLLGKVISIAMLSSFIIKGNYIIYIAIVITIVVLHFINKKINQLTHQKFQQEVPINRKSEYIKKTFHLKEFAQEIKMTNISLLLLEKINELKNELLSSVKTFGLKLGVLYGLWNVCFNILPIVVIYLTGIYLFAVTKTLTLGAFVSFSTAATVIQTNLSGMVQLYAAFAKNSFYIDDIREFDSFVPEINDTSKSAVLECKKPTITLNNVSFGYPNSSVLSLKNINISLYYGEKIALVGLNGAGKTSLIKLLLRLYEPTKGRIEINGVDIKNYSVASYRKIFSVMFQDYNIYALSVKENIAVGEELDEGKIIDSLERSLMKEKVSSYSHSFDTILSKEFDMQGEILSGGEAQKISMARFFAHNGLIAIADEPTAALDPFSAKMILDAILSHADQKTLIYITHTLSHVTNFDKIYVLDNGEVKEQGTHHELIKQNGIYAKMYMTQAENYQTKAGEKNGCAKK